MTLEEILNRTRLSTEILADVKESAAGYGVNIGRSDVRDLSFPGNVQAVAAETAARERRRGNAAAFSEHPALLRLEELATLRQLATNANARL